jgi:cytochrome d ubiquinol oxidase subunit I
VLFALPNEAEKRNDYALEIPAGASLILTHRLEGEVRGIEAFEPDRPPVGPPFFAFRVMVGMGILMLAVSWIGIFFVENPKPTFLWCLAGFSFSGWVATLAGWLVTETGRQPWLVTGLLRTADAAGDASGAKLGASLTAYVLTYAALLLSYVVVLTHLAAKGSK